MKNSNQPQNNAQKTENDKKGKDGQTKGHGKTGDAAYNAAQQKNDPSRAGRHAGESTMNDENRSGGSGI